MNLFSFVYFKLEHCYNLVEFQSEVELKSFVYTSSVFPFTPLHWVHSGSLSCTWIIQNPLWKPVTCIYGWIVRNVVMLNRISLNPMLMWREMRRQRQQIACPTRLHLLVKLHSLYWGHYDNRIFCLAVKHMRPTLLFTKGRAFMNLSKYDAFHIWE